MTDTRTIEDVVGELSSAYFSAKTEGNKKDKLRLEFFELATKQQDEPAEKVVATKARSESDARHIIEQRYPAWTISEIRATDGEGGYWEAIIEENPELQPFSIEHDGWIWERRIASGSIFVDDDRLGVDDPDLWKEVTDFEHREILENILYECGVDSEEVSAKLDALGEAYGLPRKLRPLEELEAHHYAALQDYIYEGKPKVTLAAPKKVKVSG
jgi:hypothetical protein